MLLCGRNRANHSPLPLGAVTWLGFQMGKIGTPEGLKGPSGAIEAPWATAC
jgi:hypothetical protein